MILKAFWFGLAIFWVVLAMLSGDRSFLTNSLICLVMVEVL